MPIVFNTTEEDQSLKVFGNWFNFKPGQQKMMEPKIAHAIATDKKEYGCVVLPEEFEDVMYAGTEEGKKQLASKREEGLKNYIGHLRWIVSNNQLALRQDLEQANIKADPAVFASDGEIRAMELLAKYRRSSDDEAQKRAERVKELVKDAGIKK